MSNHFIAIIALIIIPISGLAVDIYVPSLPAVSHYFQSDQALSQLTITSYLFGLALTQLFAGGVSDSFGRRKPFIISMLVFIVSSLLIPWSPNIYVLLFLRFVQGASVALTVVPMRSVILDLYIGIKLKKMINYMTIAWSIGPIIAPFIGGYLQQYFGWTASFYFLSIYSFIGLLLVLMFMPETSRYTHPFHLKKIMIRYKGILFHRIFITGLLINALMYSLLILFGVVGPFFIQSVLHYSPVDFGHIALLMGLAWFLGTLTNRIFIHISLNKKAQICLWLMFCISLLTIAVIIFTQTNIYDFVIPILLILWLGGIVFPNFFARSLSLFPETTASANALFAAFVFFIASGISAIGTLLQSTSELPLMTAYSILIFLCICIFYWGKK